MSSGTFLHRLDHRIVTLGSMTVGTREGQTSGELFPGVIPGPE